MATDAPITGDPSPASALITPSPASRDARFRRLVALFERDQIEEAVDALIAYLDARVGDPDLEPNGDEADSNGSEDDFMLHGHDGPGCPIADAGGGNVTDDPHDPEEDRCSAGDDMVASGGLNCATLIYEDTGSGDDVDAEREQMLHDVPTLAAFAIEPDPFTGKRLYVGHVNLLTSFRSNGSDLKSADSGRTFRSRGWPDRSPGVPA